ncbi:MAG: DUF4097 domain-containing protein [Acidobacteriota bacterium]|nr:DUF4097 domain-containing protein [Acidobacteriota bacterium]
MTLPLGAAVTASGLQVDDRGIRSRDRELVVQRTMSDDEWCRDGERDNYNDDRRERFCEVRQFTLERSAGAAVETSNGSIVVTGERRSDVLVRARVVTHARTREAARELAKEVEITRGAPVRATGPRSRDWDREGWSVSFRVQTPESSDVNLVSSNGSLSVTDVRGRMRLRTSNGSIRLMDIGGDVQADTSNGSVTASLAGRTWDGAGLEVATSNGSVRLQVPENYNARVVASTSNGRLNLDFPVTVQGRINREIDTTLGSGGPTVRVRTSNGSVTLARR